jgi:lipopolysaccharide export system protein LptC
VYQNAKKPPLTLSADRGHTSDDNERVDLAGNVWMLRPASQRDPEFTATMNELTVFPDEETAFTKSPVLITQGGSWLKGVGMQVNNRARTYVLESQAVGYLESKHARKKNP